MSASNSHIIINITDCHIGGRIEHHGGDPRDILQAVLAQICRAESPDLILASGDLSDTGQHEDYDWLKAQLERFNCPVLALPGNHDDSAAIDEVFNAGRGMLQASTTLNQWRIIPLDTCLPGSESGLLDADSLAELDILLKQYPHSPTLVALHHPPVAIGTPWLDTMGLENGKELMALLEKHPQVKIVLCGHVHQSVDMHYGDIRVLSSPATSRQFLPGSADFAIDPIPPGYRRIMLDESGKIQTVVERLDEQTWMNCLQAV